MASQEERRAATVTLRRQEIMAAASDLFCQVGFHAVGMDRIGESVGISGPAIYRYFDNKEALLVALFEDLIEHLVSGGQAVVQLHPGGPERLEALVDLQIELAQRQHPLISVYRREASNIPTAEISRLWRRMRTYVRIWADALREVRPVISGSSHEDLVRLVLHIIDTGATFDTRMTAQVVHLHLREAALVVLLGAGTG